MWSKNDLVGRFQLEAVQIKHDNLLNEIIWTDDSK